MSRAAAMARRYYLHVKHGGQLKDHNVAAMVRAIEIRDRIISRAADVDAIEAALLDAHDMDVTLKDYAQAVSRYIMGLVDKEDG